MNGGHEWCCLIWNQKVAILGDVLDKTPRMGCNAVRVSGEVLWLMS